MPVDNCYQRNPDTRSADVFAFAVIFIAMYACFGPACSAQQYSPNIGRTGSFGFKVSAELEALSDRSYVRRQLAMQRLLEAGPGIIDEVEPWLHAAELETRLSARKLLASLRNQRRELELSKLLEVDHKLDQLDLPCWPAFAKAAGNTRESRELFARLVRSHGDALEWLDGLKDDSGEARETAYLEMDRYLPIDINRINAGDPLRWCLLLLASQNPNFVNAPILSSRVRGGLLNPQVSARLKTSPHSRVLKAMVTRWLQVTSESFINSTTLKISIVYECEDQARRMADQLLANEGSPPAAVATALMLLARIDPKFAQQECLKRLDDQRVCHVWQVIAVRHRAVQTEVRDVAMAMLLFLEGYDPRQFGFEDIEGDPETIYRDFSMGFESTEARDVAMEASLKALKLLAKTGTRLRP